jgi:hypothetical protein
MNDLNPTPQFNSFQLICNQLQLAGDVKNALTFFSSAERE